MRLVLLGGGGFRTPLIVRTLIERRREVPVDELVLYDIDPARLQLITAVLAALPGAAAGPRVRMSVDLDDAVRGADVIFAAVRVGGAAGRVGDERSALQLGVLGQETVGAGGLRYGLRTLPVMLEIAERIAELAPRAWVLNFTNPAGMITEALRDVLGDRVIGICDSPVGLIRRVCRALDLDPADADADYVGINHLGWLRSLRVDGHDRLPELLADPTTLAGIEEGRLFGPELPRLLGALPNEYLYFFYAQRDLVTELRSGATRGEVVAADQLDFYTSAPSDPGDALRAWTAARQRREQSYLAEARDAARDDADLSGGGYEQVALDLMAGLAGGARRRVIANCRNGSAVGQLPLDMVLEIPGTITTSGVQPDPVPAPLTMHQLGLIGAVRAAERTLVRSVRERSAGLARLAFTLHPLVGSPRIAEKLVAGAIAERPALADVLR